MKEPTDIGGPTVQAPPTQPPPPKPLYRGWRIASITLAILCTMSIIGNLSAKQDPYTWAQFAQAGGRGWANIIGEFIGVSLFGGIATLCAYIYLRKSGMGVGVLVWCGLTWLALIIFQAM